MRTPYPTAMGRWRVERFAELDSTNRAVRERARGGADAGLVLVADHQTAGRGRLDRTWDAPPGSSLLVSVLLRPPPGALGGIEAYGSVVATAVALAAAVTEVTGVAVGLKWPNDLVVRDRKLAGVLAETEGDALVVGAGCNVNWEQFPPELAASATACNLEVGRPVDRDALLDEFLARLGPALDDQAATLEAARAQLVTIGRRVRIERPDRELVGEAVDVTDAGALLVRDDAGTTHEVVVGDVTHLRHT
jgi:BirA family biotin operon repressor/biotin-[acetyl-CoA-carboxylase] ligase